MKMPLAHPVIEAINTQLRAFDHLPPDQRADRIHDLRDRIKDEHADLYARLVSHLHEPHMMDPNDVKRYFETEIASAYLHTADPTHPSAAERLKNAINGLTAAGAPTLAEQIRRAHAKAAQNQAPAQPCGKVSKSLFARI
jgi:hypothetical protein